MRPSACSIEHTTASSGAGTAAPSATWCATMPDNTAFSISMWATEGSSALADISSTIFRPSARWPMASVPITVMARVTVLTLWPKAEYMLLLARRSTFCVSTGSVSTVCAMSKSSSSSPRTAPRMAPMARAKPGMSPWRRTRSHSRVRVASPFGGGGGARCGSELVIVGGDLVMARPCAGRWKSRAKQGEKQETKQAAVNSAPAAPAAERPRTCLP